MLYVSDFQHIKLNRECNHPYGRKTGKYNLTRPGVEPLLNYSYLRNRESYPQRDVNLLQIEYE
jgi:hypothetical protein